MNPANDPLAQSALGGKARNLLRLKKLGMPVPHFMVVPPEAGPNDSVAKLLAEFPNTGYFAVRSSADVEDGAGLSFAGQFASFLYVKPDEIPEKIEAVRQSAHAPGVTAYRARHGLTAPVAMSVIVQAMVEAEVSGVAFGLDPVSGATDEKHIEAVYGLGEGLVSGALDADHYVLDDDGTIVVELAEKTHRFVRNDAPAGGTIKTELPPQWRDEATLSDEQVLELGELLDTLQSEFGAPQDIEFCYRKAELFLLQTRPITAAGPAQKAPEGAYTLWDNSNIIESYPGVTTPLTFSFIKSSYETAYRQFSAYLGVSGRVIRDNERVFANTLGLLNGRVYYNLKSWYHMLAMLPGYSLNARFMEKMMGVKERFDIPDHYRLSRGKARWRIAGMAVKMLFRYFALPKKRTQFKKLLDETIGRYQAIDFADKSAHELMALYLDFEKTLLNEWKAPLLNDFFAMIAYGSLQKQCEKYAGITHPNLHNDLLCGSSDIVSVEPIHRIAQLADLVLSNIRLVILFKNNTEQVILEELARDFHFTNLHQGIQRYIADFGERCVGELKLETVSYTQDPAQFVRTLKSYLESGITSKVFSGGREHKIRENAEEELNKVLKNKPFAARKIRYILDTTRTLVSARENLRYERTRAFGIVRALFSQLGKRFYQEGILPDERDIFYLTKEEVFACLEGTSVTQNLASLVALRRQEFATHHASGATAERFATYGAPYHANDFFSTDRLEAPVGDLRGTGCSPGRLKAPVRVVLDPAEVTSLNGEILVASSTDPGWITLFAGAAGVVVERGSLLSHSAIVCREMGKPCIVGVKGLLKRLKSGDAVEMDGSLGTIKIIAP